MRNKARLAQSTIEYTILILIVAVALTAMYTYLRRSVNARIVQTEDELENSKKNYEDFEKLLP